MLGLGDPERRMMGLLAEGYTEPVPEPVTCFDLTLLLVTDWTSSGRPVANTGGSYLNQELCI